MAFPIEIFPISFNIKNCIFFSNKKKEKHESKHFLINIWNWS